MKFFLIAGELSGDILGANLMNSLKEKLPEAEFYGIGGPRMQGAGLKVIFDYNLINLIGFAEVLPHIFRLKKLINHTVDSIINLQPSALITIDSPGFCFRVAKQVRDIITKDHYNIKLFHYVAPSVWAYKPGRAKSIAKIYDHLFAILPFEPPYFTMHNLPTTFVGHPIFENPEDHLSLNKENIRLLSKLAHDREFQGAYGTQNRNVFDIDEDTSTGATQKLQSGVEFQKKSIISIMPGSRTSEIKYMKEALIPLIKKLSLEGIKIFILLAKIEHKEFFMNELEGKAEFVWEASKKKEILKISKLVIVKAGTASVEVANLGIAMIVIYKMNILSWYIIKFLIQIKYASLINIIAEKEGLLDQDQIPEFIQDNCRSDLIYAKVKEFLDNPILATRQVEKTNQILSCLKADLTLKPSILAAVKIIENLKLA